MKQFRNTHYLVEEKGDVYGRNRGGKLIKLKGRILKGYKEYFIRLEYGRGKAKHFFAHRMVAELYLDNFDFNLTVNHKDFNKLNNHYLNLEIMSRSDNLKNYHANFESSFIELNKAKKGKTYYELYPDKAESLIEQKRKQGREKNNLERWLSS